MSAATGAGCGKVWQVPNSESTYRCKSCGGAVQARKKIEPVAESSEPPEVEFSPEAGDDRDSGPSPDSASDEAAAPVQSPKAVPDPRREAALKRKGIRERAARGQVLSERKGKLAKAGSWIMVLAVLFVIGGTFMGFLAQSQGEDALRALMQLDQKTLLLHPETAQQVTVAAFIEEIEPRIRAETRLTFILNYVLAAIMGGLYFWGRKSPLAAMITAICVYAVVIVSNAVADPKTIAQGLIIKVIFFSVMFAGIRAALAQNADAQTAMRRRR